MSIVVEFFLAPDDQAAAAVLDGGPDDVFPTMSCGNFLADLAMTEWETLLLGNEADAPRVIADDGQESLLQVFAASRQFQTALSQASREALTALAHQWIDKYSENYLGFEQDQACELLWELSDLARSEQHSLYCWMC